MGVSLPHSSRAAFTHAVHKTAMLCLSVKPVWSVECRVWSEECKVQSVECGV